MGRITDAIKYGFDWHIYIWPCRVLKAMVKVMYFFEYECDRYVKYFYFNQGRTGSKEASEGEFP